MKSPHLIGILAVIILLGWAVFDLRVLKEPRYQGHALTQWLKPEPRRRYKYPFSTLSLSPEAQLAIKAIGTNAIPTLLKLVQVKDSVLNTRLNSLLDRQPIIHFRLRNAYDQRDMAFQGFAALAEEAKTAAPALALLTTNSDLSVRFMALECLQRVKPDKELMVPILLRACYDSEPIIRFLANTDLHFRSPQELEKAGISDMLESIHNQAKNKVEANAPDTAK